MRFPQSLGGSVYFNQLFKISAIQMRKLGVFNRQIGTDSKMFVDPKLLETATDEFAGARTDILKYFQTVATLIKQIKTQKETDLFWVAARNSMRFRETSNTGLGCSEDGYRWKRHWESAIGENCRTRGDGSSTRGLSA
jgi:hypothetical protein